MKYETFYREMIEFSGRGSEVVALCPFHPDRNPSLHINLETGLWKCWSTSCGKSGNAKQFAELIGRSVPVSHARAPSSLSRVTRYLIQDWHRNLLRDIPMLTYMVQKRGVNHDLITRFKIGYDGKRIIFPIFDGNGEIIAVKRYLPDAGRESKWISVKGSRIGMFPPKLGQGMVLITEGEFDCLVAMSRGYNAVTFTGGAGAVAEECLEQFTDRDIVIAYDNDEAGRKGACTVARSLMPYARSIRILTWPSIMPAGGDISDFFLSLKWGKEELDVFINQSRHFRIEKPGLAIRSSLFLPDSPFLSDYLKYAKAHTDAPEEFHIACGLSILAAACSNRILMRSWGTEIPLHLWNILLAPTGFYRKSTCINIAISLLSEVSPDLRLPDDFSREKLVSILSNRSSGILIAHEFRSLLERIRGGRGHYMEGCLPMLTELYDSGTFARSTIKDGTNIIRKAALNILSATTIEWLQVSRSEMMGGFLPRFLIWPAFEKKEWKPLCSPNGDLNPIKRRLLDILRYISELEGMVNFHPQASLAYDAWLRDHEFEFKEIGGGERIIGHWARIPTYVIKIASLIEISSTGSLVVSVSSMNQAINLINDLKSRILRIVFNISLSKSEQIITDVLGTISEGRIARSELLRKLRIFASDLDKVIQTLLESGEIRIIANKTNGRTKIYYEVAEDTRDKGRQVSSQGEETGYEIRI